MAAQPPSVRDRGAGADAAPGLAPPPAPRWRLRLLGAVELQGSDGRHSRWPTRAAAALLARLALAPLQAHARESLVDLLWPGVALDVGRNRLRQVLSTLRHLLEADGRPPVIEADRQRIRLLPGQLQCDAHDFERAMRRGDGAAARELYGGELMPGYYEEWVLECRQQLAAWQERLDALLPLPPPTAVAPAALAATAEPDRLPASWTRAFGIEHNVARLLNLVRQERLVTILGPGGSGKTRLSLEVGRALRTPPAWLPMADRHAPFERIVFVPLAACRDAAEVAATLARELQVGGRDPLQQIGLRLGASPVLLVLDNVEQVVAPVRDIVLALLEAAPGLHLLLSSRLRLNLAGEQLFALGGLPLPAAGAAESTLARNPAVALFIDRARALRPDFQPQGDELAALCALIRLLEGSPLALELAASRAASITPAQMLAWLAAEHEGGRNQLALLTRGAGGPGREARHASISAVIDWSWQLLGAAEQRLLAAISLSTVDAGLPGLAAVLQQPPLTLARQIDDLVGHSLLRARPASLSNDNRGPRVALAEAVREFVRERWPASDLAQLRNAWLTWLAQWAQGLGRSPPAAALADELPTVQSLLATADAEPAAVLQLMLALRHHWESAGMPLNLQLALEGALPRDAAANSDAARARGSAAHELLAYLRFEIGCVSEALDHVDQAERLAADDDSLRARALVRRCWVDLARHRNENDDAAAGPPLRQRIEEALTLARRCGDLEAEARALHQGAILIGHLGRPTSSTWVEAEQALARSQALWQQLGDPRKAAARLRNRGQCWLNMGRGDEALAAFETSLATARAEGDVLGCIDSLLSLSTRRAALRQWALALAADSECVALCWQHWHRHGLAYALWNPGRSLARLRRPEEALRLMAFAARFWQQTFGPLTRSDRLTVRTVQALARRQIGAAASERGWAEGETMTASAAVALLLNLKLDA